MYYAIEQHYENGTTRTIARYGDLDRALRHFRHLTEINPEATYSVSRLPQN